MKSALFRDLKVINFFRQCQSPDATMNNVFEPQNPSINELKAHKNCYSKEFEDLKTAKRTVRPGLKKLLPFIVFSREIGYSFNGIIQLSTRPQNTYLS